jgi:2-amino-4-hydroxy-6-hydroxymethyldihydropteridine diphosphokinase
MVRVFLGLGSNVGDAISTLRSAFAELSSILEGARLSRLRGSKAMYDEDQPDFVNAAVSGETGLLPYELLAAVNGIEARFGRVRDVGRPKGPRTLDIDILIYGGLVLREPTLAIPHASLNERRFALEPLLDLEPGLSDPLSGEAYSTILEALPLQGIYLLD